MALKNGDNPKRGTNEMYPKSNTTNQNKVTSPTTTTLTDSKK